MKGLILCGGKGTRLRPYSYSRPKHLLPVGNKPVIEYIIEKMCNSGIREIGVVIPPHFKQIFLHVLGEQYLQCSITYIEQPQALGLADAVERARSFVGEESFLLSLGDNFVMEDMAPLIQRFLDEKLDGLLLVSQVNDPSRYGVVQFDGDRVTKLVEKPANPPSRYAIIGTYVLNPSIFDAILTLLPSPRGEYELTDALQTMIQQGRNVSFQVSKEWWIDAGTSEDLLECNRRVLSVLSNSTCSPSAHMISSQITGPVVIGDGAVIKDSVIHGPAVIGDNAHITGSNIAANSSIGDKVTINDGHVADSIVLENASITSTRIQSSMIGASTEIIGSNHRVVYMKLGDHSQIRF